MGFKRCSALWIDNVGFAETLDTCCRPIREYRDASPSLLAHLLVTLSVIATVAHRTDDRENVRHEADLIWEAGCARTSTRASRELMRRRHLEVYRRLGSSPPDSAA
jgi:uncharacterized membrane protein